MNATTENPEAGKMAQLNNQINNTILAFLIVQDTEIRSLPEMKIIETLINVGKISHYEVSRTVWHYLLTKDEQETKKLWTAVEEIYQNKPHTIDRNVYENLLATGINPAGFFIMCAILELYERWRHSASQRSGSQPYRGSVNFDLDTTDDKYAILCELLISDKDPPEAHINMGVCYKNENVCITQTIITIPPLPEAVITSLMGRALHEVVKVPGFENAKIIDAFNALNDDDEIKECHIYTDQSHMTESVILIARQAIKG